jgi:hypothetical protein
MTLTAILLAQAIRVLRVKATIGYLPDAVARLRDRYGFLGVPTNPAELIPSDPRTGVTFSHGRLAQRDRVIVIDSLTFNAPVALGNVFGITASTRSSTDDAEAILDDLLEWMSATFGGSSDLLRPSGFLSQVEIKLDHHLADVCVGLKQVANQIGKDMKQYGLKLPEYEVGGIWFTYDNTKVVDGVFNAASYVKIERRIGFGFETSLYFSEAPLRTVDHLALLEQLDHLEAGHP